MDSLNYLKYDAEVFTPPFRLGRKQQRAVLDSLGKEFVIFPPNSAIQASLYVNYLNINSMEKQDKINQSKKINKLINIIGRIIVLPIVFLFIAVSYIKSVFSLTLMFLLYGGEMVAYEKQTKETISECLNRLNKKL